MRKSIRDLCSAAVYSSTPSLIKQGRRCSTPGSFNKGLSQLTREVIRAGIQVINIEKKYSILSVPKTPIRTPCISSISSYTPHCKSEASDNLSIATTDTHRNITKSETKGKLSFAHKFNRIRSGYRFQKNPNQENLKLALQEIETNPGKKYVTQVKKQEIKEQAAVVNKSDIEVLLESQSSGYLNSHKKKIREPRVYESVKEASQTAKIEQISNVEKEFFETKSSELTQTEEQAELKEDRSPRIKNLKKLTKAGSNNYNFYSSKAGKEFMGHLKLKRKVLSNFNKEPRVTGELTLNKSFLDYRQETLNILKDTSSFASKIMKIIRCPGRIKKFYAPLI